jgi:bifunctional DNase/RNase
MEDMLEAEIWTVARTDQGNAILLRPLGSDTVVPIFVGQIEVQSILIGLGDVKVKRPLTWDLILELARQTGLTLFRVEVHEIRDNTFFARLLLTGRGFSEANPLILDSRPSDAFALAVRQKCPVFISPRVVEQAGVPADLIIEDVEEFAAEHALKRAGAEPASPGAPPRTRPLAAKRRKLQAELEQTVAAEEYERAAEIRDLLILLEQEIEQEKNNP